MAKRLTQHVDVNEDRNANLFFENEGNVNLEVKLISQRLPFLSELSSKTISGLISS